MNWVQIWPSHFKPHYYWRYGYDIFVLFTTPEHLKAFLNFLHSRHANLSFAIENEKQNRMPFLDVQIICEDKRFTAVLFCKLTFSGIYTHVDSSLLSTYKFGMIWFWLQMFFLKKTDFINAFKKL